MPATYTVAVVAAMAWLQLAGASVQEIVTLAGATRRTGAAPVPAPASTPARTPAPTPAPEAAASAAVADLMAAQRPGQLVAPPPSPNVSMEAAGFDNLVAAQPAWVDEVLRAHNEYRCMHDAPQLTWSVDLEAHVKQWVVRGHGQRSPPWALQNVGPWAKVGENSAMGVTDEGGMKSPVGQVIAWYEQIRYTENRNGRVDNYRYELSEYTQMMWRSTSHVGCAWLHDFFVCHYGVAGNIDGQYSTEVPLARRSYEECRRRW
mmetsp:Transcript_100194/g.289297  ORF Transcript_100194/g.289297 Transcript_100194/m.289297 type:complete len:261 (+) Transcript_100194:53-835(+)